MNILRVKLINNTACKILYSILNCKNCVYLCIYDLLNVLLSLRQNYGNTEYMYVCMYIRVCVCVHMYVCMYV